MRTLALALVLVAVGNVAFASSALQPDEKPDLEKRLADLDRRVTQISGDVSVFRLEGPHGVSFGVVAFLYGVFCALWAQNTRRSAWLWFFLGLCLHVITVVFLLAKNSEDIAKEQARLRRRMPTPEPE